MDKLSDEYSLTDWRKLEPDTTYAMLCAHERSREEAYTDEIDRRDDIIRMYPDSHICPACGGPCIGCKCQRKSIRELRSKLTASEISVDRWIRRLNSAENAVFATGLKFCGCTLCGCRVVAALGGMPVCVECKELET